jgi:hypothetical protein
MFALPSTSIPLCRITLGNWTDNVQYDDEDRDLGRGQTRGCTTYEEKPPEDRPLRLSPPADCLAHQDQSYYRELRIPLYT